MTTEQLLQESIIDLQKHNLSVETRRLVDEAAQLLAGGRDMEARALVEKAQALNAPALQPETNGVTKSNGPMPAERTEDSLISRISNRLALGITNAISEAMEELQRTFGSQMTAVARSLEDRLAEAFPPWQQRLEILEQDRTAASGEAQERWESLSASVGALQEAGIAGRLEAEQRSRAVSAELERISARVTAQEERLEAWKQLVQDLTSKVTSIAEKIDRHTDLFRSMQERQAQRAAALNAVLDGIAKLREPRLHPDEAEAT
jgi:chromosome segregation ATPase